MNHQFKMNQNPRHSPSFSLFPKTLTLGGLFCFARYFVAADTPLLPPLCSSAYSLSLSANQEIRWPVLSSWRPLLHSQIVSFSTFYVCCSWDLCYWLVFSRDLSYVRFESFYDWVDLSSQSQLLRLVLIMDDLPLSLRPRICFFLNLSCPHGRIVLGSSFVVANSVYSRRPDFLKAALSFKSWNSRRSIFCIIQFFICIPLAGLY